VEQLKRDAHKGDINERLKKESERAAAVLLSSSSSSSSFPSSFSSPSDRRQFEALANQRDQKIRELEAQLQSGASGDVAALQAKLHDAEEKAKTLSLLHHHHHHHL
jgi:hypothetical protein